MKKTLIRILPLALLSLPLLSKGAGSNNSLYDKICGNPANGDPGCIDVRSPERLRDLAFILLGYLRSIFWIFAIAMLIWAAYLYLLGGTNEANVKKARQVLTYAIIGMVVALIATSIPILVKNILGG